MRRHCAPWSGRAKDGMPPPAGGKVKTPRLLRGSLISMALPSKPSSEFIKSSFTKPVRCHEKGQDKKPVPFVLLSSNTNADT